MAKVVDPDQLTKDTEIVFDLDKKTIQLLEAGNLSNTSPGSTSGTTLQCVYSACKDQWKTDATLNVFKFPLKALYEAKFLMQYGWQWADQTTRDLIRDAGWQEIDGAEYACIISLGSMHDDTQQSYYQQVTGFDQTTADFDKTGPLDEAIEIFDGAASDRRSYLKLYLREWQQTYADYNVIVEQGFSALTYIAYRAPLANAADIKNTGTTQATIDGANDPYQDMDLQYYVGSGFTTAAAQAYVPDDVVQDGTGRWARCTVGGSITVPGGAWADFAGGTWEAYPGEREIASGIWSAFNRCVQYNGVGTKPNKDEIYKYCQNALTKASDINTDPDTDTYGTVNGNVGVRLAYYVGDTLHSWPGVNFDDFDSNITNEIVLHDIQVDGGLDLEDVPIISDERTYPFTAAGNMVFSGNLVAETDVDTRYVMYFSYIATQTGTGFTVTGSAGANAVLNGTGMSLSVGEYFTLSGFVTNAANNGVKVATGSPTATVVPYTDALGVSQIDDALGDSITLNEQPFDTASAIIVDDNGGTDIDGQVSQTTIGFDFNYDGNIQGGRTSGTDAPIVVVAQGLNDSEWIFGEFTITRTTGLNFPVNAPDERTYLNP